MVERIRPRQIQRKNRNRGFRRSLADSAPGTLFERIRMKAERAAATMVKVDPANTSRECSRCGNMVDKALKDRTHRCDVCGLVCDRDENAACVIGSRPMDLGSKLPGTGSWELVRKCKENNVGFIAMKGLSGGLLTNSAACMAYMTQFDNVWIGHHCKTCSRKDFCGDPIK